MKNIVLTFSALVAFGSMLGCSTTVRHVTASKWMAPPGSPGAATPVESQDDEPVVGLNSQYYLGYWEGDCNSLFGCGSGISAVKRCTVAADNTATCVEEEQLNKVLNPD